MPSKVTITNGFGVLEQIEEKDIAHGTWFYGAFSGPGQSCLLLLKVGGLTSPETERFPLRDVHGGGWMGNRTIYNYKPVDLNIKVTEQAKHG